MDKAVFLDRDGVINRLIWNPLTSEYESPHQVRDLELYPWALESLCTLREMGYLLFLISNQPSYAKGKTSMENIREIHDALHGIFRDHGITFADYFYCYHHPNGIVPELTGLCQCRKPGTLFLDRAKEKYQFVVAESWFIGDQDNDIICGKAFGLTTIQINEPVSSKKRGASRPDYFAEDLHEATRIIARISTIQKERGKER